VFILAYAGAAGVTFSHRLTSKPSFQINAALTKKTS
jgi:hypothetical protein